MSTQVNSAEEWESEEEKVPMYLEIHVYRLDPLDEVSTHLTNQCNDQLMTQNWNCPTGAELQREKLRAMEEQDEIWREYRQVLSTTDKDNLTLTYQCILQNGYYQKVWYFADAQCLIPLT